LLLIAAVFGLLTPVATAGGATLPPGFQEEIVFGGLVNPTVVRFSPDGRVFVAEKSGLVKVFDSLTDPTASTYADLRTKVHNFWDRGLLGMALDPQFPADPFVYVLYTHDAAIGGAAPRWGTPGATSDPCPNPPGATGDGCVVSGRLSRLNAAGAETVLIEDWCQQYPSHSTGSLAFGADGALYLSGGDGASFNFVDYGQDGSPLNPCGDPPGTVGSVLSPPTAQGGSLRSQDLRTSGDPVSLDGAILRVDPATGAGLPDNPLATSPDANARRIVAYGLRNPFRINVRPGTNEVWAGDVGWSTWEEVNRVTNVLGSVENFGWPCYEGQARQSGYDGANLNICENLYAAGPGAIQPPFYSYNHSARVVPGETCPTGSSSIAGLAFYQGGPYPPEYDGALFFADYSRDCIWAMLPGAGGLPSTGNILTFVAPAANPVALEIGPGGDLFYPDFDGGTIRRIRYFAANEPPIAVAQATPTSGTAPLQVSFDGRGSSDPEGEALTYAWDLDGDGQYDDSSSATPSRTYTQAGVVTVGLRVTDPDGEFDTDSVVITIGNSPPTATITTPTAATTWAVDETIPFAGTGVDAEDGSLPASAFTWALVLHHCPSTCHEHPIQSFPGVASGAFDGPDHEYPSHLELRLTVTDSGGLTDTESVPLEPKTVQATFATNVPGLQLTVDDGTGTTPFTRTFITGSTHTVSAPATQTLGAVQYTFESWSHGAARVHQLVVPSSATYTAQYSGAAAESCFYDPATRSVAAAIPPAGEATLKLSAGGQILFGLVPLPCEGATATNTDSVRVTGAAGTSERLTIDESEAFFGPGASAESNAPEIEIVADLGDAADRVAVIGTSGPDALAVGRNGVALNDDNDADLTFAPSPDPAVVELAGGGGQNTLSARGGSGTGSPFAGGAVLRAGDLGDVIDGSGLADTIVGGAGDDEISGNAGDDTIDGGGGSDVLRGHDGNDDIVGGPAADTFSGGSGNDTIRAVDGEADTAITGGAGADTAHVDAVDPATSSVETRIVGGPPPPPPPPPPPDTTPPQTTIVSGPASPTTETSATFSLASSEPGSTFECSLDQGPFAACVSPRTYTGLAVGGHELRARATDAAGNVDPTPAVYTWTIEPPPPPPPPPPPGTGTCAYDAAAKAVSASIPAGGSATLAVVGSVIRFAGVDCGAATTANTDTVTVAGPAGSIEHLVVDQSAGALAPGATSEGAGAVSEIELSLDLGDVADDVVLVGTSAADILAVGVKGASFNVDTDLDVTFSPLPSSIELVGGGGDDTLTARGGYGSGQIFLGRAVLRGDDGDDVVSGSNLDDLIAGGSGADTVDGNSGDDTALGEGGNDVLRGQDGNDRLVGGPGADSMLGGNGDDVLEAADGEADVQIHGQVGADTAYYDPGLDPTPVSVENALPGPPP
jgi:glucose/arabinose dehydrogenase/Ca2+-binding RTX toxin-like protein